MKAFVARTPGASTIEPAEVPVPQIDDDEMLVRVHAIGVGIHDSYFFPPEVRYPFVVGIEAAGVVEQVGTGIASYHVGDRVAFVSARQPKGGTWAEFVAVPATATVIPIPSGLNFTAAASIPVAGNTALRALGALSGEAAGGSLFIAGGSGAIGTLAIQLARAAGWRVAASASAVNHEYMRGLGADLAVDYHDTTWTDRVRTWAHGGVDAAIGINPGTAADSMAVVRDGGVVVAISGDRVTPERGITVGPVPYQADMRGPLADLLAAVSSGRVHVEIGHVYPFANAQSALAQVQTRHARGKVVMRLP